jgi:hypothetical protein
MAAIAAMLAAYSYSLAMTSDRKPEASLPEVAPKGATNHVDAAAEDAVSALVRLLADADAGIRSKAAGALGALGADARQAVPELIRLLADKDTSAAAAKALGQIGKPAVPALKEALKSENRLVRKAASKALGSCATDSFKCRLCPWSPRNR